MSKKKGILKIVLHSDLCVGSGYAYAGIIDSDVCYNENGVPYIPARRLKGCLREAGEMLRVEELDSLFGKSGSREGGQVMIGNAYPMRPEEYMELCRELTLLQNGDSGYAPWLTQQKVLEHYTNIKAQTRIDEKTGVAQDTSLRYTRVVKQYLPGEDEPLCFYSEIQFDCENEALGRIVKALRHIGLNRTRGLGNVSCSLEQICDVGPVEGISRQAADGYVKLDYVVQNQQPLMLSMENDQQTEHDISGTSVLGALANLWLEQEGNSADSEMFQDIFLKGKVIFTNLTPTVFDGGTYGQYVPAPLFLNRLKKTKMLVNLVGERDAAQEGGDYDPDNGNQPKKLNTQFVCFPDGDLRRAALTEPVTEIVYHHSKKQKSLNGEAGILYSLEALQEGQFFKGSILAERKYIHELIPLLSRERILRFGKSKSAQYGSCRVVETAEAEIKSVRLHAGERVLVALASDGIFCNETGYTVRYDEVRRELARTLGMDVQEGTGLERDSMRTVVIGGYNTMWNLKKQAVPAVRSGSFFEYVVASDCEITNLFVGEKNLEGFGQAVVYPVKGMAYAVEEVKPRPKQVEPERSRYLLKGILAEAVRDYVKSAVWEYAAAMPGKLKCSPSTLGRITLMLKECLSEYQKDPKAAYEDYGKRIQSIKRKAEKEEAQELLRGMDLDKPEQLCQGTELYEKLMTVYRDRESVSELFKSLWGESMMNLLVYLKYQSSRRKKVEGR